MLVETAGTAWEEYFTVRKRQKWKKDRLRFYSLRQAKLVVSGKQQRHLLERWCRNRSKRWREMKICGWRWWFAFPELLCVEHKVTQTVQKKIKILIQTFFCFFLEAVSIFLQFSWETYKHKFVAGWMTIAQCWTQGLYLSNNSEGKLPAREVWCGSIWQVSRYTWEALQKGGTAGKHRQALHTAETVKKERNSWRRLVQPLFPYTLCC